MGADGFKFRARQTAHQTDLMDDSIKVGPAMSVAKDVWAFVIVARDLEQGLKIDAIDYRGFDVCARESNEASEKAIEGFFDIIANLFGFIIIEDRVLRIADTKDSAIGQFSEIAFDWEAANKTVMGKLRAVEADVFFLFGDFIDDDVGHFADVVAANGAFVGDGSGAEVPRAKACKNEEPEFMRWSHQWHCCNKPLFCDSSWRRMAIGKISRRCAKENMPSVSDSKLCILYVNLAKLSAIFHTKFRLERPEATGSEVHLKGGFIRASMDEYCW